MAQLPRHDLGLKGLGNGHLPGHIVKGLGPVFSIFDQDVYVGEIFTHLGNDKSKDALKESAQELLDVLMNN